MQTFKTMPRRHSGRFFERFFEQVARERFGTAIGRSCFGASTLGDSALAGRILAFSKAPDSRGLRSGETNPPRNRHESSRDPISDGFTAGRHPAAGEWL